MVMENDKTIFKYVDPVDNYNFSSFNKLELNELINNLNKYFLEYRDNINVDDNITFGIEIEIDKFKGNVFDFGIFQDEINKIVGNDRWITKNDWTLKWGREISSDILIDTGKTWNDIKNVCNYSSLWGEIDDTCGAHVHIGCQIFGDTPLYWYRFFKLWSIYENVIYRFCYGEYLTHRKIICNKAYPVAKFYDNSLFLMKEKINSNLYGMLYYIKPKDFQWDEFKNFGLSYWHILADDNYNLFEDFNKLNYGCTVELRCPNGTLDEIIWQNNIKFIISLMLYCKSEKFDEDIINKRRIEVENIFSKLSLYSLLYLEQAIELCDLIFDNNLDKLYFLRQYIKDFDVCSDGYVKAKRFTMKYV